MSTPAPRPPASETPSRSCRFPRSHRLKHRRLIRSLFDRSRDDVETVAVGCVRLLFRVVPRTDVGPDVPLQIGFAPGRRRTAVERNRVKRIMREVYRTHQSILIDLFSRREETLIVMALFRGRAEQAGTCLPHDLPRALRRAAARLQQAAPPRRES